MLPKLARRWLRPNNGSSSVPLIRTQRRFDAFLNFFDFKTSFQCAAIDYTRHTLDSAATLLNSYRYFPSRVHIRESSIAKIGSVCRRVYRIFSHAYFHHRNIFDQFEVGFVCLLWCIFWVSGANLPLPKIHNVCYQVQSDGPRTLDCSDSKWTNSNSCWELCQ